VLQRTERAMLSTVARNAFPEPHNMRPPAARMALAVCFSELSDVSDKSWNIGEHARSQRSNRLRSWTRSHLSDPRHCSRDSIASRLETGINNHVFGGAREHAASSDRRLDNRCCLDAASSILQSWTAISGESAELRIKRTQSPTAKSLNFVSPLEKRK